jgi:carboxylesterase type B
VTNACHRGVCSSDPGDRPQGLSLFYLGLARWEPYTLQRRQTMVFDIESRLQDDPRGAERRLFAKVPFIQQGS